jgi:type II secretory pathway pseudopilin PulG
MSVDNENLISRYLLGELPEEQQVEIEDRAFSDKDYLATITTVENDLIDEYVRGELSAPDRQRFESRFLASAERRKRVEFAKALRTVVSPAPEKNVIQTASEWSWRESLYAFLNGLNPAARLAFVAAAILVVAGAALLFVETLRLRRQVTQLQAEKQAGRNLQQSLEAERKRNEELNARLDQEKQQREQTDESLRQLTEIPEAKNPAPPPVIASLTLLPGLSRGGGQKPTLDLSNDAHLVRLQVGIDPEEQYKSFAVELRTLAGRQVWTRENLAARTRRGSRAVGLTLPATVLKSGEYELRLRGLTEGSGSEDVGFYYFNVRKK